jgi:hypothetical protein
MNHTNTQGSTLEGGEQKKKHKALLASVAPNAAAANFHTLNIYFDSLESVVVSVVVVDSP